MAEAARGPPLGQDQEVGEMSGESLQRADEEGRKQWNADATAQRAVTRFYDAAWDRHGERDLANREMGALICETPSGAIELGSIESGDPILDENGQPITYYDADGNIMARPSVSIDPAGCGAGRPIGFIHSHPGTGAGIPSEPDFDFAQYLVNYYNAPANIGIYVTSRYQSPYNEQFYERVTRSELADREAARDTSTFQPKWVNPNAQPCSGE